MLIIPRASGGLLCSQCSEAMATYFYLWVTKNLYLCTNPTCWAYRIEFMARDFLAPYRAEPQASNLRLSLLTLSD